MQLPAALEHTTLGDLLGTLHRGKASGVLELVETSGVVHQIQLWEGLVVEVRLVGAAAQPLGQALCARSSNRLLPDAVDRALLRVSDPRPLGERLVASGALSLQQLYAVLPEVFRARLDWLDRLPRASVRFRPLREPKSRGVSLGPEQFLHGRRRGGSRRAAPRSATSGPAPAAGTQDHVLLGLPPGAPLTEINRAFRAAARQHHPDRYVHLGEQAVRRAQAHFTRIVQSYERLRARAKLVA